MAAFAYLKDGDAITALSNMVSGLEWTPNVNYAVYSCLRWLWKSFDADTLAIYLFDISREKLELYAFEKDRQLLENYQTLEARSYGRLPQFEKTFRSLFIEDCENPSREDFMPDAFKTPSWGVVTPIVASRKLLGFTTFRFLSPFQPAAEDEMLFNAVGGLVGAQVYGSVQVGGVGFHAAATPCYHAVSHTVSDGCGERLRNLTRRERLVLSCIVNGDSDEEISHSLFISESTVKKDVRSVLAKLDAKNRTQAAVMAATSPSFVEGL